MRAVRKIRSWAVLIGVALWALSAPLPPPLHAQDDAPAPRPLPWLETVQGRLDDAHPADRWSFEGRALQPVALLARTVEGDLDPTLQVYGPDGVLIAENDDLDSLVRDAGLEALTLPADGEYTVQVTRYLAEGGQTSGAYALKLTPGFARVALQETFEAGSASWVTAEGDPLPLSSGGLLLRVDEPGGDVVGFSPQAQDYGELYTQAEARLRSSAPYAEIGLVVHAQGVARSRAYIFRVNTDGQWSVARRDETGEFVLRPWVSNSALNTERWELGVLAREDHLELFANGVRLGRVPTDAQLAPQGAVGLYVGSRADRFDSVSVLFDNVLVTTRLGTTYEGMPLALRTWETPNFPEVVAELAASGHVAPAEKHALYLPEKQLTEQKRDARFELLGSEMALYDDFILSARVGLYTNGESNACGLVYRWEDEANFELAYIDALGGFGVVEARAGELPLNVYDRSAPPEAQPVRLIVVAQGQDVALYLNGALVTQERIEAGAGRVGVALLNYEAARTDCYWTDIWVWPLEPTEGNAP